MKKEFYRITYVNGTHEDKMLNQYERALLIRTSANPVYTCLPLTKSSPSKKYRFALERRNMA